MTLKLHPIIIVSILIGSAILIFALLKGCQNNKQLKTKLTKSEAGLDSLTLKIERDSMSSVEKEKEYNDSLQFTNGIIDLYQAKLEATQIQLLATTNNAAVWKKKYENIRPDTNTLATVVPIEFVKDAITCFDSLDFKNRLIVRYIGQVKEAKTAHEQKEKLQENRIIQVISERDTARKRTQEAINLATKYHDALEPRRKVYFTLATIAVDRNYPTGVGAGFMYKDKKDRIFGIKGFRTNVGSLYQAEVGFPLSFRRKSEY